MRPFRKTSRRGFTLLELMVVVFIIGILAAVAIPLLSRYMKRSKTVEAALSLRKIYDGEVAYFQEDQLTGAGSMIPKQFVSCGPTPSGTPGRDKRPGSFDAVEWQSIRFAPDGPVLYAYTVVTSGTGTGARFTARAEGDIDGDGRTSLFERVATVDSATGEIVGGAALYELDPLE